MNTLVKQTFHSDDDIINGGVHASSGLEIQEFMIVLNNLLLKKD